MEGRDFNPNAGQGPGALTKPCGAFIKTVFGPPGTVPFPGSGGPSGSGGGSSSLAGQWIRKAIPRHYHATITKGDAHIRLAFCQPSCGEKYAPNTFPCQAGIQWNSPRSWDTLWVWQDALSLGAEICFMLEPGAFSQWFSTSPFPMLWNVSRHAVGLPTPQEIAPVAGQVGLTVINDTGNVINVGPNAADVAAGNAVPLHDGEDEYFATQESVWYLAAVAGPVPVRALHVFPKG
jgi:hypothetical protein